MDRIGQSPDFRRSLEARAALAAAMAPAGACGVPNPTQFLDPAIGKLTDNNLALSLQTVARIIAGRSAPRVSRQIFCNPYLGLMGQSGSVSSAPPTQVE